MELKQNHVSLTSTQEIKQLASPLKVLNVDYFSYTRYYYDGTSICLLTHTDWYEFFLKEEAPGCINVYNLENGCNLWVDLFPEKPVADARNQFGIENGIHFSYRKEKYVEAISFASGINNRKALGSFIANIDLLEKFIEYFRERAEPLIRNALPEKIIIPEVMRGYETFDNNFKLSLEDRLNFLSQIGYKDICEKISSREYECLSHLSAGLPAKEIAKAMNISSRTVESHIANMKEKFNCSNKTKLLEIYWKLTSKDNKNN